MCKLVTNWHLPRSFLVQSQSLKQFLQEGHLQIEATVIYPSMGVYQGGGTSNKLAQPFPIMTPKVTGFFYNNEDIYWEELVIIVEQTQKLKLISGMVRTVLTLLGKDGLLFHRLCSQHTCFSVHEGSFVLACCI